MSFASEIKKKLCETDMQCEKCRIAEIAGMLRFSGSCRDTGIRFVTENECAAKRLYEDIKEAFGIEMQPEHGLKAYTFFTESRSVTDNICECINGDVVPFACCRASYVRGAFLGGGSISDPQKSYHLEFGTKSRSEADFLIHILTGEGFSPKITERKGKYVVYIKECEQIADILGYIGAGYGTLEMFTIQVEKQLKNDINRRVNCENANTDKMVTAASRQMAAINKLKKNGEWENLPETLREIGKLREENPDVSLKELGQMLNPPIGKSGVNHRLNRIMELAEG